MNDIFILPLLGSDKVCLIDSDLAEEVIKFRWILYENKYAINHKDNDSTFLHTYILGRSLQHKDIDHINKNKLDNRRCNLRFATRGQNIANQNIKSHKKYKGVYFDKHRKLYAVRLKINYKNIHIGRYKIIEDAAKAYNEAVIKYYGEFAVLNPL